MIVIGGYALRVFIKFSRYTRDCDFILMKKNGWNLDLVKKIKPRGYSIQREEKYEDYGFLRLIKPIKYEKLKIKISFDFMEGEIRGRKKEDVVLIDKDMFDNSRTVLIPITDKEVKILVPNYPDYFIMKVVSARASDIRDIASMVHENGIPKRLKKRIKKILPYPEVFKNKISERVIPEIKEPNFIDSWKGIFATTEYTEKDKKRVLKELKSLL